MWYSGEARRRLLSPAAVGGCAAVVLAATATLAGQRPAAAAEESYTRPASGVWVVEGRGYGHGRGMAQWGARAAAAAGRSGEQILAFYYPGTVRTAIGNPTLRVRVGVDPDLVVAPERGLRAGWRGGSIALPSSRGVDRWRITRRGAGLGLRYHDPRGWFWWGPALPATVDVGSARSALRVHRRDGTSVDYRGVLTAARSGAGTVVVNRLRMQAYLAGVVPRESPSYWPTQALRAQAIAARTYAYARMRRPLSKLYDICDSTACQVYGGASSYAANGRRRYGEQATTTAAVASTSRVVLMAGGRPATTEYSASNGGWSVSGGVPYLVARVDPYVAGDPYRVWRVPVRAADVGRRFGIARLDRLVVLRRDGQGAYGGRLVLVRLVGVDRAGRGRSVEVSGGALRSALGLRGTYFRLRVG